MGIHQGHPSPIVTEASMSIHFTIFKRQVLICVINGNLTITTIVKDSQLNRKGEPVLPKVRRKAKAMARQGKCTLTIHN